jgi:hypothetical protein
MQYDVTMDRSAALHKTQASHTLRGEYLMLIIRQGYEGAILALTH